MVYVDLTAYLWFRPLIQNYVQASIAKLIDFRLDSTRPIRNHSEFQRTCLKATPCENSSVPACSTRYKSQGAPMDEGILFPAGRNMHSHEQEIRILFAYVLRKQQRKQQRMTHVALDKAGSDSSVCSSDILTQECRQGESLLTLRMAGRMVDSLPPTSCFPSAFSASALFTNSTKPNPFFFPVSLSVT